MVITIREEEGKGGGERRGGQTDKSDGQTLFLETLAGSRLGKHEIGES
jgi:hypothetical protein